MTITDAITKVLKESVDPLGHKEIFKRIVDKNYYSFGAKDPEAVVRSKIRKHCFGINFPSASPKKLYIHVNSNANSRNALYQVWDGKPGEVFSDIKTKKDELPEEIIHRAYSEHLKSVSDQLLEFIKLSEPEFFESLVVRLLLKMGYGWDQSTSGNVVGGKSDEGIDGIINEDKLGLEKIYIQAKRYADNKVSPSEIRDFIGAMAIKGARKGVFFTSSKFTEQACQHAKDAQNMTITLIDGTSLTELLVQYGLGVAVANVYQVIEVDRNFFSID
ncbi:TPA: restriction endonuclease [Vibrio vulnificus]|uniref:restriction endonuclease n=1 Tax=Vibrio vulnificus TaxID=672 RepID=UPI00102C1645|nr:restriction endonuclease [Vibrio vulnificus]ELC9573182.1 restriction endonuclease [Vibrio vulnificus]ELV8585210.1 restriction endonuclease [Vibrio vulnificus]ELV8703870.1 restriction endonuclease [Vibrio vulnificus]ELV8807237.1 restriction endonuclease [Vibrio vulnificus]MCU8575390.1 restriction endonuclease [Vibrio vulnificus]